MSRSIILDNCRLMGCSGLWTIDVADGLIRDVRPYARGSEAGVPARRVDVQGACALPGLLPGAGC